LASNQLKLVASKEVLTAIAKVEDCQRKNNNITKEFFANYGEIFKMGNQNMIKTYAEKFQTMDEEMQEATQKLRKVCKSQPTEWFAR
jgi:ureidoglycolate hydrolase